MFTADRRYIVDGKLAAFKGERMSEQEAVRRGIRHVAACAPALPDMTWTKARLVELCEERGIEVPQRATNAEIIGKLGE